MTEEKMNYLKGEGIDVFSSLERLGNDMDLLEIIIGMFFKDADTNVTKFVNSIASGDKEEAYNAVHTLKSLSANLSMNTLYGLCTKACELYKSGNYEECIGLKPQIMAEYNRVVKVLREA